MRFILIPFFICSCFCWLLSGCNSSTTAPPVSDELRNEVIQELRLTLNNQPEWVKVHAAEYLLWLDYPEGVQEVFIKEDQKYGEKPQYRIGIWRVLAQATPEPEMKKVWIDKIINAFQNTKGTDRIHAAETLAKLRVVPSKVAPETTQDILEGDNRILTVCTLWGMATSDTDSLMEKRKSLLDILSSSHPQASSERKAAAYALRHLRDLTAKEWYQLAEMALSEPEESTSRIFMLSAAFVTTPPDSVQSDIFINIREDLLLAKNSQNAADLIELTIALAERGKSEDLSVLISLLNNKHSGIDQILDLNITESVNADIRSAASYAILRIDRRQEYSLAVGDWLTMGAYILGMLWIGFYFSRRNKSEKDFLLGGGRMNPVAVGMSLFATLLSSLTYLSLPGELIKYGPFILTGMLAFPLAYFVVGWFLIPRFKEMNVTSAYEILEVRLGVSIRMLATFLFLSLRFLWMATIVYVTVDIAIISVFNFNSDYSLLVSAILMIITIVYTSLGGLKAVVYTDVIQSFVLVGGAILTLVVVSAHFGSPTAWLPDHWFNHWSELRFNLDLRERATVGNIVLSVFVFQICASGSDQMSIQRFLATKDVKSARKTYGVSLISLFVAQMLLGIVGLALISYFMVNPHYLADGKTLNDQADQLFPKFILVGFPVGVSGLVAAGIFAAAMSSLSSGLNSSCSVISEDIIKRFKRNVKKPSNELRQVRKLSFFVGVFTLILSISIGYVEGNLTDVIFKVVNLFIGPLFVLFFLALFIPFATAPGTFIGGLVSVIVALAIAFFDLLQIEVFFIMPISLLAGVLAGALCSYIDSKIFGNWQTASNRAKNLTK